MTYNPNSFFEALKPTKRTWADAPLLADADRMGQIACLTPSMITTLRRRKQIPFLRISSGLIRYDPPSVLNALREHFEVRGTANRGAKTAS
jgi:hypothetical protein